MAPASWPRAVPLDERLMHVDPSRGTVEDRRIRDLPDLLRSGDVLVVNDAATLPASLHAHVNGKHLEIRLLENRGDGEWNAVLFGPGDWRTRTESRIAPPRVRKGDSMTIAGLSAYVTRVAALSPRLVTLKFHSEADLFWNAVYRFGRPVQYAHLGAELPLWHVQTPYAARPWAVEMPSAGRPLRWGMLLELRRKGVLLVSLTHAAGLSSTGDAALDGALPLPEHFDIPSPTVEAILHAKGNGGRVVAVGTTVVRALEGSVAANGALRPSSGRTPLRIGPDFRPKLVDGLLTGVHEPGTSHFDLMRAFVSRPLLEKAHAHALSRGYLSHEFGDSVLILSTALEASETTGDGASETNQTLRRGAAR
jgi:S-adenosylmethionine:tRNA ribosyltransferase-isomerase